MPNRVTTFVKKCRGLTRHRFVVRLVQHPLYFGAMTLFTLIAGCYFSLYSVEIRNAWPVHFWNAHGPICWPAAAAWSCAVVAAVGFAYRDRANNEADRADQQLLVAQADELAKLVRTMPPANFLAAFAELCSGVDKAAAMGVMAARQDRPGPVLDQSIRSTLQAVARLARLFDGEHPTHRYAANVMVYRATADMDAAERAEMQRRLRFHEDAVSVDKLAGVLDLEPDWSASTDDESFQPDPHLPARFSLPVPHEARAANKKYKVLPGAPRAFVDGTPDIYFDFERLRQWCREDADFSGSITEELYGYFTSASAHISSFISIPLRTLSHDEGGQPEWTFAVLNVHCNQTQMLRGENSSVPHFVMIARPILISLARLIRVKQRVTPSPPVEPEGHTTPISRDGIGS